MPKRLIIRDSLARTIWAMGRMYCAACGIDFYPWTFGRWREVHHVVGNVGRSDEPTNWLALCARCHRSAEGQQVRGEDGELLPTLSLGACLTIKKREDPEQYDAARLARLYGSNLPELEPVPEVIDREYRRRRGKRGN